MTGRKLGSSVIAVALAFTVGAYVGVQWRARDGNTSKNLTPDSSVLRSLRNENRRLSEQLKQLRTTVPQSMMPEKAKPEQCVRGVWRALANLKTQQIAQSRLTVVSRGGQLNDTFVTLFDLAPAERESLQLAVNRATEKLAALEAQNATVSRDEKGIVTIAVKPFPGPGGGVYDELMKSFTAALGQERYGAFVALGAEQVEGALANFGAQERILRISYDPQREKIPYVVKDEFRMGPRQANQETSTFQHRDEIAVRFGTVARLLPPDLGSNK
jgi:hypothetical protein